MEYDIDIDHLRSDLKDYYGTVMLSGFPMAMMELSDVERASDTELIEMARKAGIDISNYICS